MLSRVDGWYLEGNCHCDKLNLRIFSKPSCSIGFIFLAHCGASKNLSRGEYLRLQNVKVNELETGPFSI